MKSRYPSPRRLAKASIHIVAMFRAYYESLPPDRFMGRNLVRDRLRELARSAYIGAAEGNDVQSGVLAAASDPRVAPVLERVTRTRLAFLERQLEALGLDPPAARAGAEGLRALCRAGRPAAGGTAGADDRVRGRLPGRARRRRLRSRLEDASWASPCSTF